MGCLSLSRVDIQVGGLVVGVCVKVLHGVVLTDSILGSILIRGCHELRSLDLSSSPSQLTDYSLHLIGWLI